MAGILWLASYPKSGNTWLRAFLANLVTNPARPVAINKLPEFSLGDGFHIHYEQFSGKKFEDIKPEEIPELRRRIHEWFARSRPDNAIVKTHNAIAQIEGHPLITPSATAGAVYVIRNPMDVAISFAHHYQIPLERAVESLCDPNYMLPPSGGQMEQFLSSWSGHFLSWTRAPGLPLHLMRYEDMLKQPYRSFAGLVDFLGLPKEKPRIRKAIRFSEFKELKSQEAKERFVEARPDGKSPFFREGKAGAWRETLTPAQVDKLVETHGEVMREVGYLDPQGNLTV